jgi:hypothetical protein
MAYTRSDRSRGTPIDSSIGCVQRLDGFGGVVVNNIRPARVAHALGFRVVFTIAVLLSMLFSLSAGASGAIVAKAKEKCIAGQAAVSCVFSYNGNATGSTGSPQTFIVPKAVTQLTVEAWGAEGGDFSALTDSGGPGGYVKGSLAVQPGDVLSIRVGGKPTGPTGGYNGGGAAGTKSSGNPAGAGGGATDVRLGGHSLAHRIIVAGGGGGGAYNSDAGGPYGQYEYSQGGPGGGGGSPGGNGTWCEGNVAPGPTCGSGASTTVGGPPGYTMSPCAVAGNTGSGGAGCGGGGGGGYFGGGGGGYVDGPTPCCSALNNLLIDGSGGGGSGYVASSVSLVSTQTGLNFGNGMVRISYASVHADGGLQWSSPQVIDTSGGTLTGVSCPTTTFCMAVDSAGNAATFDGTSWTSFTPVAGSGNSFYGVSCASPTLCAVVGTDSDRPDYATDLALIYDNGSWSSNGSPSIDPGETLTGIACARNTQFCEATGFYETGPDEDTVIETYNGTSWTTGGGPGGYGSGSSLPAVSCASRRFCVFGGSIVDREVQGDWLRISYHGQGSAGQITNSQAIGLSGGLTSAACAGTSCVVAGNGYYLFAVHKTTLTGPSAPDGLSSITALSCATGSSCWAVDAQGNVLQETSGAWTAPVMIDSHARPVALSCPVTTFCVAVDNGNAFTMGT